MVQSSHSSHHVPWLAKVVILLFFVRVLAVSGLFGVVVGFESSLNCIVKTLLELLPVGIEVFSQDSLLVVHLCLSVLWIDKLSSDQDVI